MVVSAFVLCACAACSRARACAPAPAQVLFPNIDAIFGLLGGTTAVVIAFVAPALFWERFVGFMYPWSHPRKLMSRGLLGFAVFVAALSLPALLVDAIGDLYATAWWVPMASAGDGLRSWKGGLDALAAGELVTSKLGGGGEARMQLMDGRTVPT